MIRPSAYIDHQDSETLRAIIVFLDKRLAKQETIDWALNLKPGQRVERIALEYLLDSPGARELAEPWATAWRLIEESWSNAGGSDHSYTAVYGVQERLRAGDRSGAVIAEIVNLVAPRLKVEPTDTWRWDYVKKPRTPKTVEHVLSARLTSGQLIDLNVLELAALNDIAFLTSLATSLESAVNHGLDIARRLGWDETRSSIGLGFLHRVYYTQPMRRRGKDGEPDVYHHGIAPSVKLLHAVVAQISTIAPNSAQPFIRRWRANCSRVFIRLWAAMARSSQLVPTEEVESFLQSVSDRPFWDVHAFPEIAELRAVRFGEFDVRSRNSIAARLQKGPPRDHWPRKTDRAKVANARQYWTVRELRRIEVAGGVLPSRAANWLSDRLPQFAGLEQMTINDGFLEGVTARFVPPNPDSRYDELEGVVRLQALETALAADRAGWDDDPAQRANDWINQEDNSSKVLADLESVNHRGDEFPRIWNRFGWAHKPRQQDGHAT